MNAQHRDMIVVAMQRVRTRTGPILVLAMEVMLEMELNVSTISCTDTLSDENSAETSAKYLVPNIVHRKILLAENFV